MTRRRGPSWAVLAILVLLGTMSFGSILTPSVRAAASAPPPNGNGSMFSRMVTLPPGSDQQDHTELELWFEGRSYTLPPAASISRTMIMRGQPVCVVSAQIELIAEHLNVSTEEASRAAIQSVRVSGAGGGSGGQLAPLQNAAAEPRSHAGLYLIVAADQFLGGLDEFVEWKTAEGYDVRLYAFSEIGNSVNELQGFMQTAYDTWEDPPLYLLIVGDVEHIPAHDVHTRVCDHKYACLDGDDFVADLYVGRLSVKTETELATIVAKTVKYQREPFVAGDNWFKRALMVAGNEGSSTPKSTCRWAGEQLMKIGYDRPDSAYVPLQGQPDADADDVIAGVDKGVSIIAYRGWAYGDIGWEPPLFTNDDLPLLNNGWMLPAVFSIVCHTGNFGNSQVDCFGESWLKAGSAEEPSGAVTFMGTAEWWSHSRWNDGVAIEVIHAIVDDGERRVGPIMVTAKTNLMLQFPTELEMGLEGNEETVEYYNYTYNLLGDPSLEIWTDMPRTLVVSTEGELVAGQDVTIVTVFEDDGSTPIAGARVAASQAGAPVAYAVTDTDGQISLALQLNGTSDVTFTVTGRNLYPWQRTVSVTQANRHIVCTGAQPTGDTAVLPGAVIDINLTMYNSGTQSVGSGTVVVTAPEGVTLLDNEANLGSVSAGSSVELTAAITAELDPDIENGARLRFDVQTVAPTGTYVSEFWLAAEAPELRCTAQSDGDDDNFDPGETFDLVLTLANDGIVGGDLSLTLSEVTPGLITFGDTDASMSVIANGQTGTNTGDPFTLTLADDVAVGTVIPMELAITHSGGPVSWVHFNLVVGRADFSTPMGPDAYGYYCYDNADIDYRGQVPAYHWIECSALFGGDGTKISLYDNKIGAVIELPFPFKYYGASYDSLRIHDNGWVAFDTSYWYDIRNWSMPNTFGSSCQVAPFWDNLVPDRAGSGLPLPGTDAVYTYHDEENHLFVIEWSRLRNWENVADDFQTFEVILRDPVYYATPTGDGEIIFQYKRIVNDDPVKMYSTVGIEDQTEKIGLQYTYANEYALGAAPLAPGLAIKFTTEAPVYEAIQLSSFSVFAGAAAADDGVALHVRWDYDDERPLSYFALERAELGEVAPELLGQDDPAARRGLFFEPVSAATFPVGPGAFADPSADPHGNYVYRMKGFDRIGKERVVGEALYFGAAAHGPSLSVGEGGLAQGEARILYNTGGQSLQALDIYDVAGRKVVNLQNQLGADQPTGSGELTWDGRDGEGRPVPGGMYWVLMRTAKDRLTTRLVIVR